MTDRVDPPLSDAPHLAQEAFAHLRGLVKSEWKLARAEMTNAAKRAGRGAIFLGVALALALVAFHALAITAILALAAAGIPLVWAALITTVGVLVLALICLLIGRSALKPEKLSPKRTLNNLRSDMATIQEVTRA